MHDLDRTQDLYESGVNEFEGELEAGDFEFMDDSEVYDEQESAFNEVEEMELAAELLGLTDEAELDQFLGKLIKKAAGTFLPPGVIKPLGGLLKGAIKKALPIAGSALGNLVVPGIGGAIGGKLASKAGSMFGLELEGLSPQDQEFEVARQVVRLAGDAVKNAAEAPPNAAPQDVVRSAVIESAQKHAPGLLRNRASYGGKSASRRSSGRWVRRGRTIVLLGV